MAGGYVALSMTTAARPGATGVQPLGWRPGVTIRVRQARRGHAAVKPPERAYA